MGTGGHCWAQVGGNAGHRWVELVGGNAGHSWAPIISALMIGADP
ncbi:unnamed protein product [Staurois parvus]|uniref:Uncharacterized protein n=1 Tax=Staurois parvus TaxID=386267 RepID=A0ABN9CIH5_9NEOB|nr:unnamed protein product [Staurois parvus]